jgi:hypothetical protein
MKDLRENHKYRQRYPSLGWGDHEERRNPIAANMDDCAIIK